VDLVEAESPLQLLDAALLEPHGSVRVEASSVLVEALVDHVAMLEVSSSSRISDVLDESIFPAIDNESAIDVSNSAVGIDVLSHVVHNCGVVLGSEVLDEPVAAADGAEQGSVFEFHLSVLVADVLVLSDMDDAALVDILSVEPVLEAFVVSADRKDVGAVLEGDVAIVVDVVHIVALLNFLDWFHELEEAILAAGLDEHGAVLVGNVAILVDAVDNSFDLVGLVGQFGLESLGAAGFNDCLSRFVFTVPIRETLVDSSVNVDLSDLE